MRLVHFSDLHLGFRQYQRLTPAGINQREADVAASFKRVVDRTIELAPDVVLIAGDVFHTVRPTNQAILFAFRQLSRLTQALPDARIIMVAGNHDTPRSTETGCILRLFGQLGISIVDDGPQRLTFPELDLAVLAVPDVPGTRPALRPEPGARYNVLLLHGEVEGMLPAHALTVDRAALEISREELGADRWDYVALGHYHVYRAIAPNAYYSGSIDYTSANAWGEKYEEHVARIPGKGLIEHDLATGAHTFHAIEPSRDLLDLVPISASGLTAPELDDAIREAIASAPGGIEDKIVRLIVRDLPRHLARELDHKALREYQRRALHFVLDARRPEATRSAMSGAPGKRPSLADLVREKLQSRVIDAEVSREALVALGLHYLGEAERTASSDAEGAAAVAVGRGADEA